MFVPYLRPSLPALIHELTFHVPWCRCLFQVSICLRLAVSLTGPIKEYSGDCPAAALHFMIKAFQWHTNHWPGMSCLALLQLPWWPAHAGVRSDRVVYLTILCVAAAQSQALIGHCLAVERQCNIGPTSLGLAHRIVGIVALSLYLAPHMSYVRKGQLDLKHMPYSAYRWVGRGDSCPLHMRSDVSWGDAVWSGGQPTSANGAWASVLPLPLQLHAQLPTANQTRICNVLHTVFWLLPASSDASNRSL